MKDRTVIVWTIGLTIFSSMVCLLAAMATTYDSPDMSYTIGYKLGYGLGQGLFYWVMAAGVIFAGLAILALVRQIFLVRK